MIKNPLRKRYLRELKTDFGKYAVIFLFMIMLIALVSGFLIADNNFHISYNEGFEKYNCEDGHLTFHVEPKEDLLETLEEKADLTFSDLRYFDEKLENDNTLRVYVDRETVNTECLMEGSMPTKADEIAIDRMHAQNNQIQIGDQITVKNQKLTVTGLIALVDYSCLFEKNTDMMFDAIHFGVGVMTQEGFNLIDSKHMNYNYAWKYNQKPINEEEEDQKSEDFLDVLEDEIKAYDTNLIQVQVDALYDEADRLAKTLENQMEEAGDVIEEKMETAGEEAAKKAIKSLGRNTMMNLLLNQAGLSKEQFMNKVMAKKGITQEQVMMAAMASGATTKEEQMGIILYLANMSQSDLSSMLMKEAGLSEEDAAELFMEEAAKKAGTTKMGLVADELGTTGELLQDMIDSMEDMEDTMDDVKGSTESKKVDLDELEDSDNYEADMDFSLDGLRDVIAKIELTGLYDMTAISKTVDALENLTKTEIDDSEIVTIDDYVARYNNNAINFTGEDMGSDAAMFTVFNYIVIIILAFVFAVTISNTITKEAGVIGTLRATGYTRREMVLHYLTLPVWVTIVAAIIGNILGYTIFTDMFVGVYYNSYSLATYENHWNMNAFVNTTVVPIALMVVINLFVLIKKLQLTPLQFLRRQLSKKQKKKAIRLNTKMPIMLRFGLRILFQNIPAYLTLAFGIMLGGIIIVFGTMFGPLLDDYAQLMVRDRIAEYQTIVIDEDVTTEISSAEKFCMTSLDLTKEGFMTDGISVYGIEEGSQYLNLAFTDGAVYISNGIAEKFGYKVGDEITLDKHFGSGRYSFRVGGIYEYNTMMSIFMSRKDYISTFDEEEDYFTGYFSKEELIDIDADDIAATITQKDLTKVADQLKQSMGDFIGLFKIFGVIMFLLLIYLMTKQIIEKNLISISMTKILGFTNKEIGLLYLAMTFVVVLAALLINIPIVDAALHWAFSSYIYTIMTGYIPYIVSSNCYVIMGVLGIVCFFAVSLFMMLKISRIPKSEALKNVE